MRRLLLLLMLFMAGSAAAHATEFADRVIVVKSERKLYLMNSGKVLQEIPVSLGLRPNGDKQKEGDFRTPEGEYVLERRNNDSRYFLSIQVSYPNTSDRLQAEKIGVMQLFTICMNDHMTNIHNSLDWMLIPVQNEGFKYLTNNFIKQK